jgi:hypothetical protein
MTPRRKAATIQEAIMLNTLTTGFPSYSRPAPGTTLRSLAQAMRSLAAEHGLALRAAAEAELPRRRQSELRTLYTAKKK